MQVHAVVGGPVRSAGGTGSWDLNTSATELEAGSYALKALGMDHGLPSLADGSPVWRMSDEHLVFRPAEGEALPAVGTKVRVLPAHIDPTMAYHERLFLVEDDRVLEAWPVDLRGW
jgi:hypothetical protein